VKVRAWWTLVPRGPLAVAAGCAALVLAAHVVAVRQCPLPEYGMVGAEYIEHHARGRAIEYTADQSLLTQVVMVPLNLRAMDDEYPALLHLVASMWARVAGQGISASIHLNTLFVLLLAAATAFAARQLAVLTGRVDQAQLPWVAALAASAVLLLPVVFATARRYYYDLPMTAWCALALAALLVTPRWWLAAVVAGMASAAAVSTKWTAGFFLAPVWVACALPLLSVPRWQDRWVPLIRFGVGGLLCLLLCLPLLLHAAGAERFGSLDFAVGGASANRLSLFAADDRVELLQRLRFTVGGLVTSSVGPLLAMVFAAIVALGVRVWKLLIVVVALCALPILAMTMSVDEPITQPRLLPMMPWIVAAVAVAWGAGAWPRGRWLALAAVVGIGAIQVGAVGGWWPLPGQLGPRSPFQQRGWSAVGERTCSPHAEVERLSVAACDVARQGGAVHAEAGVATHHGFRWQLREHCPADVVDDLGLVPAAPDRRPAAALTTREPGPAWGEPSDGVVVQMEEARERVGLYVRR
jgi:hypothetical protein